MEPESNKTLLFKIIVVGDSGVGKTSIINRYVHGFFSKTYKSTIGVDFALKELELDGNKIKLQLWDIAGQERYNTLTHIYYRQAVGAILVFDLSKPTTFEHMKHWKRDIDEKVFLEDGDEDERNIPCILVANKADLNNRYKDDILTELDPYVRENGYRGHFKTSALKDEGIKEAIEFLIRAVHKETKEIKKKPIPGQVDITGGSRGGGGGGGPRRNDSNGGCPC